MAKLPDKISLQQKRCFNHANREPVAMCPSCKRYYCRECITEHKSRLLCSKCLEKLTAKKSNSSNSFFMLLEILMIVLSFTALCLIFAYLGWTLTQRPDEIHQGSKWF